MDDREARYRVMNNGWELLTRVIDFHQFDFPSLHIISLYRSTSYSNWIFSNSILQTVILEEASLVFH